MRRINFRIMAILATALLAFAAGGCVEPLENNGPGIDPDAVKLPIRLYIPGAMPATKASAGDVDGVHPESQIYSVQVWMFNHYAATSTDGDAETAVAYAVAENLTGQSANLPNGSGYYKGTNGYTTGGWTDEDTYELSMWIPGHVIDRPAEDMKFDFYVLANGESIGCTADQSTTRGALKAMSFGFTSASSDFFGVSSPKTGTSPEVAINGSVGANGPGLPISGFFNKKNNSDTQGSGIDLSILKTRDIISDEDVHTYSPIVQLKRAVSKVRFVFAAPTGMTTVAVTGITLDDGIIPVQTYTFPREDGTEFLLPSTSYSDATASVAVPTTIGTLADPNYLRSTCDSTFTIGTTTYEKPGEMSAQEYDTFLNAAVTAGYATESYAYFRESDQPITGTITYSLDGGTTTKTATFNMPSPVTTETNFHRNHSWIVYAYFQGNGLYIKPVVLYWEDGTSYTYEQHGSAVVAISDHEQTLFSYGWTTSNDNPWWQTHQNDENPVTEWYFRRQDEGYTDNWAYDWLHSQMVCAPGLNAGGAPIYANRIELRTNGFLVPLRLKLSNTENFYLVTYNAASAEYVSWIDGGENLPAGWTEAYGALIPTIVSGGGTTYFYVVPKDGTANEGKTTVTYLVTDPTDGSGSQKLPFNAGVFPGSNENTEINFYSVSVDTFKSYYTTRPDNIKPYDKDGEVTI